MPTLARQLLGAGNMNRPFDPAAQPLQLLGFLDRAPVGRFRRFTNDARLLAVGRSEPRKRKSGDGNCYPFHATVNAAPTFQ